MAVALRGCASSVLAASFLLAVACSTAPPKSPEQERADAATSERIYAALEANPIYYFRDVEVSVDDGVALLSGYVWSTDAIYAARKIAGNVPGITGVMTSQLQLERNGRDTGPAR